MPTCYVDFNAKRHQYFLPPQIPLGKLTSLSALPYPMYGRGGRERRRWGRKRGGKDKGEEREYMEARWVLWSSKKILKIDPDERLYFFKRMTYLRNEMKWMKWKCGDLKCVQKPTRGRLSLTHDNTRQDADRPTSKSWSKLVIVKPRIENLRGKCKICDKYCNESRSGASRKHQNRFRPGSAPNRAGELTALDPLVG